MSNVQTIKALDRCAENFSRLQPTVPDQRYVSMIPVSPQVVIGSIVFDFVLAVFVLVTMYACRHTIVEQLDYLTSYFTHKKEATMDNPQKAVDDHTENSMEKTVLQKPIEKEAVENNSGALVEPTTNRQVEEHNEKEGIKPNAVPQYEQPPMQKVTITDKNNK